MHKFIISILAAVLWLNTLYSSGQETKSNATLAKTTSIIMKYDTLSPEVFLIDALNNSYLFRVISPDDCLFDYRLPDYNGGFYLFFQIAQATDKESKRQIPFDRLRAKPVSYVLRYCPAGNNDIGGGFSIPQYNVYSIRLPEGVGFEQFEPESKSNQWEPYKGIYGSSDLPDPMMLRSSLNVHSADKREATNIANVFNEEIMAWQTGLDSAAKLMHCDLSLIEQLKNNKQYDTIIHADTHHIYLNIDMESYEQATAPDNFYITYKKYYPGGALKELQTYLPSVYGTFLPVGYAGYYNESGELENVVSDGFRIFPFYNMANVAYCIGLLEREGFIDLKTGSGKATMQINHHINPNAPSHGEPRLSIRAPWGIQADDRFDGTVGLLAVRNGVETVYIIEKHTRTILDKFTR